MNKRSCLKWITISVVSLGVLTQSASADLMKVDFSADKMLAYQPDKGRRQSPHVFEKVDYYCSNSSGSRNFPRIAYLDSWSDGFSSQANTDIEQPSEIRPLQIFTTGPGSLNLCLSALLGLCLYSSAHFVKKLSFNFIPEWYHNGGPFQIGHSYAVMPESLYPIAVYCFIQPTFTVEDYYTQYRLRTLSSIQRKTQFTPAVIEPRGPPLTS